MEENNSSSNNIGDNINNNLNYTPINSGVPPNNNINYTPINKRELNTKNNNLYIDIEDQDIAKRFTDCIKINKKIPKPENIVLLDNLTNLKIDDSVFYDELSDIEKVENAIKEVIHPSFVFETAMSNIFPNKIKEYFLNEEQREIKEFNKKYFTENKINFPQNENDIEAWKTIKKDYDMALNQSLKQNKHQIVNRYFGYAGRMENDGSFLVEDSLYDLEITEKDKLRIKQENDKLIYTLNNKEIAKTDLKGHISFTLKDKFTEGELKYIKQNTNEYKDMNDEEWNKEINTLYEKDIELTNEYMNQNREILGSLTSEERNEIEQLGEIGSWEYFMGLQKIEGIKPLIKNASIKYIAGEDLSEKEIEAIKIFNTFQAHTKLRGVDWSGELVDMVKTNIGVNIKSTFTQGILNLTACGVVGGLFGGVKIAGSVGKVLGGGKVAGLVGKASEVLFKYGMLPAIQGGVDFGLKTLIFDELEDNITDKKIQKSIQTTDKGELVFKKLSQVDEEFINYQAKTEGFIESWSERALDPILPLFGKLVPKKVLNSTAGKIISKFNSKLPGTTYSGFVGEHLEEIFGESMKYILGANNNDTSISEAVGKYLEPKNLALSSASILITGGLMSQFSNGIHKIINPITGKETKQHLESLNDTIIKTDFKKKGIEEQEVDRFLQGKTEKEKEEIRDTIFKRETKEQQEKYNIFLNDFYKKIESLRGTEEANKITNIYNVVYSTSAINYGVSREQVANRIKLDFESVEEELESRENKDSYNINYAQNSNKNEIEVLELTNEFNNIKFQSEEKIAKEVERKLNKLIGQILSTSTNPLQIEIKEKYKGHIINSNVELKHGQKTRHNTSLMNLERIINNSILLNENNVDSSHNSKKTQEKKESIESYRNFETYIKLNDKKYNIKITTEINKNSIDKNISDLYNIQVKPSINKNEDLMSAGNYPTLTDKSPDTILKQINSNVKPNQNFDKLNTKGRIILKQSVALIQLYKGKADQSTLLHESAHYFLELIKSFARDGYVVAESQLKEIKDWTASFDSEIGVITHERFARGFEQYIRSGKYENSALKNIFEYFKDFLRKIYSSAEELEIDINNPQMFKFFDKYLNNPQAYQNDGEWIYRRQFTIDEGQLTIKEESELTIEDIEKEDNIFNLTILKQGTAQEELKKEIDRRIRELQNNGETEDYIDERIGLEFAEREFELIKKTIDDLEVNKNEDLNYLIDLKLMKKMAKKYKKDNERELAVKKDQEKKTRSESESIYKDNKTNEYIEKYNNNLEKLFEKERGESLYKNDNKFIEIGMQDDSRDQENTIVDRKENKEKQDEIRKNLFNFINKLFAKSITEEQDYILKVFERVNKGRQAVLEEAKEMGIDVGVKPYKNIQEMLNDFENINSSLTWKQKINKDRKAQINNDYGDGAVTDYTLTLEEYDNIVNFRKKYLKNEVLKLEKELNNQNKEIERLFRENIKKLETNNKLENDIKGYKEEIQSYKDIENILGSDIKTIAEVDKALGEIKDTKLREKLLKYSSGGHNAEYVLKKIKEYKNKEIKKDYQAMIDNVLLNTTHISKKTGKEYGNVIYEDSGFFRELKEINKYSKSKAEYSLLKLESERATGQNKDSQSHYELKKQLLYFKSKNEIEANFMNEILTNLGNFAKESEKIQDQIKIENFYNILKERKEIEGFIEDNKVNRGKLNLSSTIVSSLGNLKSILEFIGGKKLADKFDFVGKEIAFDVGVKKKQDVIFNSIFDILSKSDSNKKAKKDTFKIFEEYNKKIATITPLEDKITDKSKATTYRDVVLKANFETLKTKIRRELEHINKTPNNEKLIELLDSINPTIKKGKTDYKYKFSSGQFSNLMELLSFINKNDHVGIRNKEEINKLIKSSTKRVYEDLKGYDINMWGLMYFDLLSKNKHTEDLLEKYYANDIEKLNEMIANAPQEFKEIEEILFKAVQDRNELNPFFIIEFGRDMGQVENYFDRRSIHNENDLSLFDMISSDKERMQKVTAIEQRSRDSIPDLRYNPLELALRHQRQTEYVKNIAPSLKNMEMIFNTQLKDLIREKKGDGIVKTLENHIDNLKYNNENKLTDIHKIMNYFTGNWAKSVTNTPSVLLKQMTSFLPYSEGLNKADYMLNYTAGWLKPKETMKFMKSISPYIHTRFNSNEFRELIDIIKIGDKDPIIEWFKKFNSKITFTDHTLTELGDILSVIYGGYARYKTNIDSGMTHEESLKDFEKQTVETQQSQLKSLKSSLAINGGFFENLASMFKSQDNQYFQKNLQNLLEFANGDRTKAKFLQHILLYNFLVPASMTAVSGLINNLYGRKDKDKWYYLKQFAGYVGLSFFPVSLLTQSVAINFATNYSYSKNKAKQFKTYLENLIGVLFGKTSTYNRIFFERYYESIFDLYDTEETKEKKNKR